MHQIKDLITGAILAGGQGQRMGGEDKGLILFNQQPLYQHVIQKLTPQVAQVVISANRNHQIYQQSSHMVFKDTIAGYPGPLAGMLTILRMAKTEWVVFAPCDTPFIPDDYVKKLWQEKEDAQAVWVRTMQRDHPTLALLHTSLASDIELFLLQKKNKVMQYFQQVGGHAICFCHNESAFININTPDELSAYQHSGGGA